MRVLYVTSRFPYPTLTFVANEMAAVEELGVEVSVAPVWPALPGTTPQPIEELFLDKVVAFNWRSLRTWQGVVAGLVRRPSVLGLIARLLPGHLRSPYLAAKLVASVPKALFLGNWASHAAIDHIHAHFLTSPTTVAMLAAHVAAIPYSATAHAFDITATNPKLVNGSVPLKCLRSALSVTISEYNLRFMQERWPQLRKAPLRVIYNGIDTERFAPRAGGSPPLAGTPTRILSVAALNPKKGFPHLISAVGILRDRGVPATLEILGEGRERAHLEQLIASLGLDELVRLSGAASQDVVAARCREADLFALASIPLPSGDADGLPTVLIEALAAELPTVSTRVTGIPEIVEDGTTGRCVPPGDAAALADAIQWMIEHPEESRAFGRQGRRRVLESFDRRRNAAQLLAAWRQIEADR